MHKTKLVNQKNIPMGPLPLHLAGYNAHCKTPVRNQTCNSMYSVCISVICKGKKEHVSM